MKSTGRQSVQVCEPQQLLPHGEAQAHGDGHKGTPPQMKQQQPA